MLYEDITYGALFFGVDVDVEGLGSEGLEAIDAIVKESEFTHFVPGDTVYGEPEYVTNTLIGLPVLLVDANEEPGDVSFEKIEQVRARMDELRPKLAALGERHPAIAAAAQKDATLVLACCGPLCFASLSYGELWPSDDHENAQYEFSSQQNMDQEWCPVGVDGTSIASAEFSDMIDVEVTAERLERWRDRVSLKKNPSLYVAVRYD